MAKVICKLANASEEINGVAFAPHPDGGMVSEDIPDDAAAVFASIEGYKLVGAKEPLTAEEQAAADAAARELDELRAKAKELGVEPRGNWKADRLRAEIDKAEKDKAAKAADDTGAADGAGEQK